MPQRRVQGRGQKVVAPARHLVDVHMPAYPTRSWLEEVEAQRGYTPRGLKEMRRHTHEEVQASLCFGGGQEFQALRQRALKRAAEAKPAPQEAPRGFRLGPSAEDLEVAGKLRELLGDMQWHGYQEVLALVGQKLLHESMAVFRVMEWGDMPNKHPWQVPVYCYGKADSSGFYALWDSAVAVERREARAGGAKLEAPSVGCPRGEAGPEGRRQNRAGPCTCDGGAFASCCGGTDEHPPKHTQDCSGAGPQKPARKLPQLEGVLVHRPSGTTHQHRGHQLPVAVCGALLGPDFKAPKEGTPCPGCAG